MKIGFGAMRGVPKTKLIHPLGKAKRCAWSIPTKPFTGRHYAVYPPELIETPIKAGCPKGGIVLDLFMGSDTRHPAAIGRYGFRFGDGNA
jgi:DNA modification methylase